jgi:MOSC domain-containing protein
MGTVLECWRYPVKSAAGEAVGRVTAVSGGVLGDRRWAVMDGDGTVVSAKHPAGSTAAVAALSQWLGRPVTLADTVPDGLRLHRLWPADQGMVPDWEEARPGQEAVTRVNGAAGRRFVDYGAVHLVTTGALARLARAHGCPVAPVRFRPNLLLDLPADPVPGDVLTVGEATLRIDLPTPRCIIPSLPQPGAGQPDTRLLSTLARHHREQVPGYGRAAVFGCYAVIEEPGSIESGAAAAILGSRG